jgi:hypothetical protein
MDIKLAKEAIKSNYPPENYTILREALDWLIERAEKAERMEMMHENTGSVMNRRHLMDKVERYERALKEIEKSGSLVAEVLARNALK